MIRNVLEYKSAVARLAEERQRIAEQRDQLQQSGLSEEQVEPMIGHLKSGCRQLEEEVATYERRTAPTWRVPVA